MRSLRAVLAAVLVSTGPAFAGEPLPHPSGPYPADTLPTDMPDHVPHTLADALGITYETNPQLTGQRAKLRATDEGVPTALAGWRPTVTVSASWGAAVGRFEQSAACGGFLQDPGQYQAACYKNGVVTGTNTSNFNSAGTYTDAMKNNRGTNTQTGTITQYLYRGGHTLASTNQAENDVFTARAQLIAQEETIFGETVNAYVTFVENTQWS